MKWQHDASACNHRISTGALGARPSASSPCSAFDIRSSTLGSASGQHHLSRDPTMVPNRIANARTLGGHRKCQGLISWIGFLTVVGDHTHNVVCFAAPVLYTSNQISTSVTGLSYPYWRVAHRPTMHTRVVEPLAVGIYKQSKCSASSRVLVLKHLSCMGCAALAGFWQGGGNGSRVCEWAAFVDSFRVAHRPAAANLPACYSSRAPPLHHQN